MESEIKRVPLDFDWPLKTVWQGYINPYYVAKPCSACSGTGYSIEAKRLSEQWYGNVAFDPFQTGSLPFTPEMPSVRAVAAYNVQSSPDYYSTGEEAILREARRLCVHFNSAWQHHLEQADVDALLVAGRLRDLIPEETPDTGEQPIKVPPTITASLVNEWSIQSPGHNSLNCSICVLAKCKRLGINPTCSVCQGHGDLWPSRAAEQLHDAWTRIQPPTGEGWQVWEMTPEGSPISPVFSTESGLIDHLVSEGYSRKAAQEFAKRGWVKDAMVSNGRKEQNNEDYEAIVDNAAK